MIPKALQIPRTDKFILTAIVLVGLVFRLYKINAPLADLHSWRQVDTAAVARNFERNGFNLLRPQYDDISSNQTGYENPEGLRMVEFPLYNAIFGKLHQLIPALSLDVWGRITTIFFSLIIIKALYVIALKEDSRAAAIGAAATYAAFPFFVFFSRVILPETMAASCAMLSVLFMHASVWDQKKSHEIIFQIISAVFLGLALLVKPTAIFYGIAIDLLFFRKYGWKAIVNPKSYVYLVVSLAPLIWWRTYIQQFPEGIPASGWLITHVNTFEGMRPIFMRPAFFRWIFYERLSNIVLGGYLTALFVLGLLKKAKSTWFIGLLLAATSYLFIFQGGNVQHEYYQTLILPAVAAGVGLGLSYFLDHIDSFSHKAVSYSVLTLIIVGSFLFSWYRVSEFYRTPNDLVQIAQVVSSLTGRNDRIVTDRNGDTTLLYLSDRKGAPSKYLPLPELAEKGYSYYITQNGEEIAQLKQSNAYPVIFESTAEYTFALFKLR